jgi:phosphoribosyl-AMP cyclohydrolase
MAAVSIPASSEIDFAKGKGIVPVVTVDHATGRVLMFAYMNREAFEETVATGRACYFSRSRQKLWRKGEESGNFQVVREIRLDCDGDTLMLVVEQRGDGAACHEGYQSCFFRALAGGRWEIVDQRKVDPAKYGPNYGHPKKSAG